MARESRTTVRDSLAVGLAVGASGISFGAVAVAAGLSVPQACAASLLIFTGASQFALVGVLGAGGAIGSGIASAIALGMRNSFYSLRLASLLRLRGFRRFLGAQVVTDESTAMATSTVDDRAARLAFGVTGITLYLTWNLATLVGAVAAGAVPDPNAFGIDAAVPAAFLALVAPRLRDSPERRTAALAVVLAIVAVPLLPVGVPVLVAALAVVPAALMHRRASRP